LRRQGFVPDDRRAGPVERDPVAVAELEPGRFTLGGVWRFGPEAAAAGPGAHVAGRVQARRVFMVLAPPDDGTGTVRVSIDGEPITAADAGADLTDGIARIDGQRLYRLVDRDSAAEFVLEVELSPGTRAYTFTFG
jgi:hypothetical protein